MALYIISIIGSDALVILINLLINSSYYNLSTIYIILGGVLGALGIIAIDGITATIVRRLLPEKWFNYKVNFHKVSKKECKFYEKLGIKKWKDHIIELGMFTSFSKKTIAEPASKEYMERFILESNYGVWCHLVNIIAGFLIIFCYPFKLALFLPIPLAIVNLVLSSLPLMILRYNLPRLHKARDILEKKASRTTASSS